MSTTKKWQFASSLMRCALASCISLCTLHFSSASSMKMHLNIWLVVVVFVFFLIFSVFCVFSESFCHSFVVCNFFYLFLLCLFTTFFHLSVGCVDLAFFFRFRFFAFFATHKFALSISFTSA